MSTSPVIRSAFESAAPGTSDRLRSLIIVSGAAAGIGLATVRRFLASGWECVAIDSDNAGLERVSAEGRDNVHPIHADLLAENSSLEVLGAITQRYANVTVVNNLGGSRSSDPGLTGLSWSATIDTLTFNLLPTIRLMQGALPLLKSASAGRVVNVSSAAARVGTLDVPAAYAASKAALIGLARQWMAELARSRILINTVCPGIVATDRIKQRWEQRTEAGNAAALARIPLQRLGTPEEVAEVIHFLGSHQNTYMTGAVLDVNGGMFAP